MEITEKQQEAGTAVIEWVLQHFDNFADVIDTKTRDGKLSTEDTRIRGVLDALTVCKKELEAIK